MWNALLINNTVKKSLILHDHQFITNLYKVSLLNAKGVFHHSFNGWRFNLLRCLVADGICFFACSKTPSKSKVCIVIGRDKFRTVTRRQNPFRMILRCNSLLSRQIADIRRDILFPLFQIVCLICLKKRFILPAFLWLP